jgi:hypothetical protein
VDYFTLGRNMPEAMDLHKLKYGDGARRGPKSFE